MKTILSIILLIPLTLFSQETTKTIDKNANFPGGMNALREYLMDNIEYPEISMLLGEQGTVIVEFVVNKDGSIEQTKVLKGVSKEIDEEALRVVNKMPNWEPAVVEGNLVRARCKIPINFMFIDDLELSVKSLKAIFKSNKNWYSSNMDSSYFKSDTLSLVPAVNHLKIKAIQNAYVWSVLNKKEMGFRNFDVETALSSPIQMGYKYRIEKIREELLITFMYKNSTIDRFKVLEINAYPDGRIYQILIVRES